LDRSETEDLFDDTVRYEAKGFKMENHHMMHDLSIGSPVVQRSRISGSGPHGRNPETPVRIRPGLPFNQRNILIVIFM
jgi:hypothetical protein